MKAIKGPAVFLAQFAGDAPPFNSLQAIAAWAAGLGFKGVQIPSWDRRLFDLEKAAESQTYCDEVRGVLAERGLQVTELSTHLQGQLVAVHPAYDTAFDGFAAPQVRGKPQARAAWAVEQLKLAARASRRLGISEHATFSGALAWPYLYPWPPRPAGLVETAFDELARRWRPILDAFDEAGVNVCYEIHPGEDLHDGVTFEMFLDRVGGHKRCNLLYDPSHFVLQQLDYLEYIDLYHERIRMFHVKDAEFNPTGRQGVYGGFQPWIDRAGRFRSLGDGQVNCKAIFSKLAQRARDSGADLGLAPDRAYMSFAQMAAAEAKRPDGIEVVSIVTPNDSHHAIARAFLDRGIDVICDKPMTTTVEDALDLVQAVRRSGLVFGLTHNYTGYPLVRQAREMVAAGELGPIRVVQVEYVQDWLTTKLEDTGHKQAGWRVDPQRAGAGGCLGDIGTHAYNLADFVTGLHVRELAADLGRFVQGRRLDDNVHVLLRYESGVRGMLWASQVAPGNENGLRLRVYGETAGLEWSQEHPNQLRFALVGRPPQVLSRGGPSQDL